jgi:hypothetical protein
MKISLTITRGNQDSWSNDRGAYRLPLFSYLEEIRRPVSPHGDIIDVLPVRGLRISKCSTDDRRLVRADSRFGLPIMEVVFQL